MLASRRWIAPCLMAASGLMLASCAETAIVANTTKEITQASTPAAKSSPVYKVGKPYQVDGVWYYPGADYSYVATGIASWYGPDFHGKLTANGEVFDMNEVTGAHKTLPLPTIARVTNLDNGRSIMVRINDRGPFVNGRIIDLSRRAAQLLGFEQAGTAKVRVEVEADQSRQLALSLPHDSNEAVPAPAVIAAPRAPVEAQALPPPGQSALASPPPAAPSPAPAPAKPAPFLQAAADPPPAAIKAPPPVVTQGAPGPTNVYVQAGAFSQFDNANRLRAQLSPLGDAKISPVLVNNQQMFRVRLGPLNNVGAADQLLDRIIKAGYKNAELVVAE
jgi:rare lipoprotein A